MFLAPCCQLPHVAHLKRRGGGGSHQTSRCGLSEPLLWVFRVFLKVSSFLFVRMRSCGKGEAEGCWYKRGVCVAFERPVPLSWHLPGFRALWRGKGGSAALMTCPASECGVQWPRELRQLQIPGSTPSISQQSLLGGWPWRAAASLAQIPARAPQGRFFL